MEKYPDVEERLSVLARSSLCHAWFRPEWERWWPTTSQYQSYTVELNIQTYFLCAPFLKTI